MQGDGVLPLREAVTTANANGEADEIGCAPGLEGTLRLANGRLENGRLAIGDAVRISGDTGWRRRVRDRRARGGQLRVRMTGRGRRGRSPARPSSPPVRAVSRTRAA